MPRDEAIVALDDGSPEDRQKPEAGGRHLLKLDTRPARHRDVSFVQSRAEVLIRVHVAELDLGLFPPHGRVCGGVALLGGHEPRRRQMEDLRLRQPRRCKRFQRTAKPAPLAVQPDKFDAGKLARMGLVASAQRLLDLTLADCGHEVVRNADAELPDLAAPLKLRIAKTHSGLALVYLFCVPQSGGEWSKSK